MAYTTIKKPSDYFNTKLYTGNGTSQSITGVGFQPDLVWTKSRTEARGHNLMDAVRGTSSWLGTNSTSAEQNVTTGITSFDSNGFSIGTGADFNNNSQNYVSWNWLASNTTASNTDGSITSTVTANTTSGFSIVKYTGDGTNTATIGHGLGVTPSMVIMKPLDYVGAWWITHKNLSTDNVLEFNTNAQVSYSSFGGGGLRQSQYTSLVITGGAGSSNSNLWNQSGQNYIAYCFAEKQGFSKFGSYTGNGSTDGTFVYTGFKPAFVIVKCSSSDQTGNAWWIMYDNKRIGYNSDNRHLGANSNDAEYTANSIDLLSNGFKLRDTNSSRNVNGATYIYMAFAEEPLVGDNPATAR